jgi:hypothetical protein
MTSAQPAYRYRAGGEVKAIDFISPISRFLAVSEKRGVTVIPVAI